MSEKTPEEVIIKNRHNFKIANWGVGISWFISFLFMAWVASPGLLGKIAMLICVGFSLILGGLLVFTRLFFISSGMAMDWMNPTKEPAEEEPPKVVEKDGVTKF